jgi:hypothetical protein
MPDSAATDTRTWTFYAIATDYTSRDDRREIHLAAYDVKAIDATPDTGRRKPDAWVTVHDRVTGEQLQVRRYPCGLGCKCDLQWQALDTPEN